MAAGDHFQISIPVGEAIGIVENLDVVLVAFRQVDRVVMLPVVMVLVLYFYALKLSFLPILQLHETIPILYRTCLVIDVILDVCRWKSF